MDSYSQINNTYLREIFINEPSSLGTPFWKEKQIQDGVFSCVFFGIRPCGIRRMLSVGVAPTMTRARRYAEEAAIMHLYNTDDSIDIFPGLATFSSGGMFVDFFVQAKVSKRCYNVFEDIVNFPQ